MSEMVKIRRLISKIKLVESNVVLFTSLRLLLAEND